MLKFLSYYLLGVTKKTRRQLISYIDLLLIIFSSNDTNDIEIAVIFTDEPTIDLNYTLRFNPVTKRLPSPDDS